MDQRTKRKNFSQECALILPSEEKKIILPTPPPPFKKKERKETQTRFVNLGREKQGIK